MQTLEQANSRYLSRFYPFNPTIVDPIKAASDVAASETLSQDFP